MKQVEQSLHHQQRYSSTSSATHAFLDLFYTVSGQSYASITSKGKGQFQRARCCLLKEDSMYTVQTFQTNYRLSAS